MAYGIPRKQPANKFGAWLDMQMCIRDIGGKEVAEALHCTQGIISWHRTGKRKPTFCDVVAYCWLFKCKEDPETIWKLTAIQNEE